MREIRNHLDAIEAGMTGAIEDYERSDTGAFFETGRPRPKRPDGPDDWEPDGRSLDDEMGLAEILALSAGEIDLAEHPSGEVIIDEGAGELLGQITGLDLHQLAAAVEIGRMITDELAEDD
jgi:hypothetical protein